LAHLRLERMRALDRLDPLGHVQHLGDPFAGLRRGEVAAHPGGDRGARADVERPPAGVAENVDAGGVGQVLSQVALGPLGRGESAFMYSIASSRVKILWLPRRPISAWRTSTVALASSSARCTGLVLVLKYCASVESLWLGTSSSVSTRRASAAVSRIRGFGQV